MPVTTIKLSDELKRRVARLAADAGTSAHAFMQHAVEEAADAAERRQAFVADALAARAEFARSHQGQSQAQVAEHARRRVTPKSARRPVVK